METRRSNGNGRDPEVERRRRMEEAVRDLPDPERRELTQEDIDTLHDAGLDEIAEVGKRYVRS